MTTILRTRQLHTVATIVFAAAAAVAGVALLGSSLVQLAVPTTTLLERATPAPFVVDRGNVIGFTPFTEAGWGLQLAVPKDAIRQELGDRLSFTYADDRLIFGTYTIDVERRQIRAGSPSEGLELISQDLPSASAIETVTADGGRIVGALRTYAGGAGSSCASSRVVVAVFMSGAFSYVLRISSDAPARCDARTVPQTTQVIDSIRFAAQP